MLVPVHAVRRRYVDVLTAAEERPVARALVPRGKRASGLAEVVPRTAELAVVGVEDTPEAGAKSLAVVAGEFRIGGLRPAGRIRTALRDMLLDMRPVAVPDQRLHVQRLDVHLVKALLHRGHVDLSGWIGDVAGRSREAAWHLLRRYHADVALSVYEVRTNHELIGLAVDHPVRGRASDGLAADSHAEVGRDLVEFVGRSVRKVRTVRDRPEPVRPFYERARAALALVVEHREFRVDSAYRRGGEEQ